MEETFTEEFHKERAEMRALAVRGTDASRYLDIFLACAVAGVLGNRFFLIATGYPQVGNGTLHISHAVWGGVMMVTAIVAALSFIAPNARVFVAFVGGAGFGWFVDELGKFITRDVNYFFRPTLALIYVVFVALYMVFRSLERRSIRPDEALLNAIEALKSGAVGRLDESRRRDALALLDRTCCDEGLVPNVRELLHHVATIPPRAPGRMTRFARRLLRTYERWTEHRGFVVTVTVVFVLLALSDVAQVLVARANYCFCVVNGSGTRSFTEWATVISSLVSLVFVIVGVCLLRRSRLAAFRWFEASVLVAIFVTQVFLFADHQLVGVADLFVTLLIWIALRSVIRLETAAHAHHPAPAPTPA